MQIILPYGKPLAILALMVVALHNLCMSPPPSSFGGLNPNLEFGFFLLFLVFRRGCAVRTWRPPGGLAHWLPRFF